MKILIASSYHHAWNSVRPEAEMFIEMVRQGHQVTVATQGDADYVARFREHGVKVIDCYPKKKICLTTIKTLHKELKDGDYDICYGFNSKTIPNAAFACFGTRAKMVTYRGTTGGLYRHDPSAYLTHLHPRVNGIVCVSDAVRHDVSQRVWKHKDNIVTIYKGHQLDWYSVAPTERAEFGLNDEHTIAVCAAHVRPSKGISVLVEATHHIDNPNFHLLLVGSGFEPHFDEIKQSPMADRIHLVGHRQDVPSIMAMADFQVQPSISGEGLPRTIIEAMANGTTSVVTTTGGSPELVDDGKTGFIVPTKDAKALAKAMNTLINDKALIADFSQAAQHKLATEFNADQTVKNHIRFFEKIIKS
ncbi:glycosyltransferase family 4 protein [Photobacterium aphoticum]|uniref:Glycosyl transferase family 1 n=1 Tax=Photobacterium aphoticum TaxID=754436 RepID=A0A0J1GJJ6_9GAMM|nr:glycosyltransferase family 4 protein [Photobacterium aphoticum]KLU99673.1 glycosyl transferase family 1 [Photobacterium aphoticum]PSU55281.1 glycosyltransferase family 1 protein [Photobacterium aphoticum]GHA43895.1 WbnK-like family glycosyltransferase [Photobacterium aphoticum]